jgi:hypothetical protein
MARCRATLDIDGIGNSAIVAAYDAQIPGCIHSAAHLCWLS